MDTGTKIDMFINDSLTFSYPRIQEEGSVQWPFDVPFFLLLNQILGGWAGEYRRHRTSRTDGGRLGALLRITGK